MVCPISVVRVCFIRIQMFGLALVCVEVDEDKISVFDTGPGMDGSDEKSIVKWGKMGASVHRSTKKLAVGGKPPFLTVFA
ncbi:structural maintenance of chromosomes flexible hinge domain-containing protein GMI1 isoform X3 [Spinacia oleracea]|nr:structural maintenance of chromosomes flexible hinge domain-containing protein GMI1-like isoform X3 [Spinacia oleracea]